jgi:hypothetical protein
MYILGCQSPMVLPRGNCPDGCDGTFSCTRATILSTE